MRRHQQNSLTVHHTSEMRLQSQQYSLLKIEPGVSFCLEFRVERKEPDSVPRVKHMQAPRIQHHVTEAGPPSSRGVLNVVATLEQRPIMLNAKLICSAIPIAEALRMNRSASATRSEHVIQKTNRSEIGEFSFERGDITNLLQNPVIVLAVRCGTSYRPSIFGLRSSPGSHVRYPSSARSDNKSEEGREVSGRVRQAWTQDSKSI